MQTAKVIVEEKERERGPQVLPFLRERIGQPRQSANHHSHRQIASLDVRRADKVRVRVSPHGRRYGLYHVRGTVTVLVRFGCAVYLYQLCEVNPRSQAVTDGIRVSVKAVCGHLKAILRPVHGLKDFLRELYGVARRAASQVPRENQFRVTLKTNECISVSELRVVFAFPLFGLFFHADEAPHFISLNVGNFDVADFLVHEPLATLSGDDEHAENGIHVNVAQPRRASDAAPFRETVKDAVQLFVCQIRLITRFERSRREGLFTLAALIAGRSLASIKAVRIDALTLAFRAFHGVLSFLTSRHCGNTIRIAGLYWHSQCQSGYGAVRCYKHLTAPQAGAPYSDRTSDLPFSRQALYPTELTEHKSKGVVTTLPCSLQTSILLPLKFFNTKVQTARSFPYLNVCGIFGRAFGLSTTVSFIYYLSHATKACLRVQLPFENRRLEHFESVPCLTVQILVLNFICRFQPFQDIVNRGKDVLGFDFIAGSRQAVTDSNGRDVITGLSHAENCDNGLFKTNRNKGVEFGEQVRIRKMYGHAAQRAKSHDALFQFRYSGVQFVALGVKFRLAVLRLRQFGNRLIQHGFVVFSINHARDYTGEIENVYNYFRQAKAAV